MHKTGDIDDGGEAPDPWKCAIGGLYVLRGV